LTLFTRLRRRLPEDVAFLWARADDRASELFPEEVAVIRKAVLKRRREFSTGRVLARRGLEQLGLPPACITPAPDRTPCWPKSVVGSITHSNSVCAVAMADAGRYLGIGLDLERSEVKSSLASMILGPAEPTSYAAPEVLKIVFCAKEALYKCLFPIHAQFLAFSDIEIRLDTSTRSFEARLGGSLDGDENLASTRGLYETDASSVLGVLILPRS
jgi:4'-phosphopantetheinyl transferase EntD